jgi:hypothetical protein
MRAAVMIVFLATACAPGSGGKAGLGQDTTDAALDPGAGPEDATSPHRAMRDGLTMFFRMDESGDEARLDHVSGVPLVPWQRTGLGSYDANGRGTTAVTAVVGAGQHISGSVGYHFATSSAPAMKHDGASFTWAGWVSVDTPDTDNSYLDDQTWLAKWNGTPDTAAPSDHREYRVWHDQGMSRWRFEVSSNGLSGPGNSQVITHPASIERERLYFLEAWHDADRDTVNLRVSTQTTRGTAASIAWRDGVFSGDADLDVGAQNTCTDDHLQGIIDALGHWNRVLTEEESILLWNGGAGVEL